MNVYLQVRQHFELQEDTIVKGKYILIKKPTKNKSGVALPICTKERIYDMLFEIYMALENPGMSAFWDEVSSQYAYVPQHLTECFVKQCKINVENEACKKLIAAKPIIATKFMTRVEVDLIQMPSYSYARDHSSFLLQFTGNQFSRDGQVSSNILANSTSIDISYNLFTTISPSVHYISFLSDFF